MTQAHSHHPAGSTFSDEAGSFSTDVIDSMAGRVGVLDADERFIAVNKAWKTRSAALGLPANYPLGCHLHDVIGTIPTRYARLMERGYLAVVEGRRNEFSCAYPIPTRGEDDWFKQSLTRMTGHGPGKYVVVVQSIQELKRAERRLRLLNDNLLKAKDVAEGSSRAKSVFLAMMSHEMRTPLNGVMGMAQVMALGELPGKQRDRLDVIQKSGGALLSLLTDLLDLSRLESGGVTLEDGRFEPQRLADVAEAACRPLIVGHNVRLHTTVTSRARGLWSGDERRIQQILHVLLSNSAKFTAEGFIDLNIDCDSSALILRVQDTGVGIAADQLAGIFETFVQGDGTLTRRYDGCGLGLAICRSVVDLMGGDVRVESAQGVGTTFTVTLPAPAVRPVASPGIASQPVSPGLLRA